MTNMLPWLKSKTGVGYYQTYPYGKKRVNIERIDSKYTPYKISYFDSGSRSGYSISFHKTFANAKKNMFKWLHENPYGNN